MLMFFHAGVVREEACWILSNINPVPGSQVYSASLFIVNDNARILKNVSPFIPKLQFLSSVDLDRIYKLAFTVDPVTLHNLIASYSAQNSKRSPVDIDAKLRDAFLTETFQLGIRHSLPKGM